jgi:hypothetical protein
MTRMLSTVLILGVVALTALGQPPLELPPPRALPQAPPQPVIVAPSQPAPVFFKERDLEKHVERLICVAFGPLVRDVEADVYMRRREIDVEFEVKDAQVAVAVQQFVLALPELQGWKIRFDVEYD